MPTDDYIKRSDALFELHRYASAKDPVLMIAYRVDLCERIEKIPAADVEPVVRCKDCKHRPLMLTNEIGGRVLVFPGGEENPCPCQNLDDDWYSYKPDDDFFCAYGAKMDKEEDSGNDL